MASRKNWLDLQVRFALKDLGRDHKINYRSNTIAELEQMLAVLTAELKAKREAA